MKVISVSIYVDPTWSVTISTAGGKTLVAPVTMRRVANEATAFPMPSQPVETGALHAAIVADATGGAAQDLYQRAVARDLQPGDVDRYGRWLFDALLGEAALASVVEFAKQEQADVVELALSWPASEHALARLHWEAMRSRAGFLAASNTPRFAVTRRVRGANHVPRPIPSPTKALFVIGGDAFDDGLRPGAELLAVLQSPCLGEKSFRAQIITRASSSQLRTTVSALQPDVVHVIAHGIVEGQSCLVELAPDDGEVNGQRNVDQLSTILNEGGRAPTVLVLSVCESGRALPLAQTGSFAAELVARGIPIVIGMAGRVANSACRLFARRFGQAVIAGEPIIAATEEGRRAAFLAGLADRSLDWAYPALFLAEGVPADFRSEPPVEDPVPARIAAYRVQEQPVFCARQDVIEAFRITLTQALNPVLAIWSDARELGLTRVLKELTAEALRSGHVPCLLCWPPDAKRPQSLQELARDVKRALLHARAAFQLAPPATSPVLQLLTVPLATLQTDATLPPQLRQLLALETEVTAQAFALALAHEFVELARDARAQHQLGDGSRAVLLVDDVHRWDKALVPFLDTLITASGLGQAEEPVPVVMTFSTLGPAAPLLRDISEGRRAGWRRKRLEKLRPGEDMLAYQTVLLHPYTDVLPNFSDRSWAFDYDAGGKEQVDEFIAAFRDVLEGAPARLGKREFYAASRLVSTSTTRFVVAANDEPLLQTLRGGNGAPR